MNIIARMLKENTGIAMMDSGGASGRHWQWNQKRKVEAEPATKTEFRIGRDGTLDISIQHNVYHWLNERVSYARVMQQRFDRFCKRAENQNEHMLALMQAFPDYLKERGHRIGGLYGEGNPMTVNTYNGEDCLSQVLQYTYFECDGDTYALIQIHGGADVRGGYSDARAFKVYEDTALFDNARATLHCKTAEGCWFWDSENGGYSWDSEEAPALKSFPLTDDVTKRADGIHILVTPDMRAFMPDGNELKGYSAN